MGGSPICESVWPSYDEDKTVLSEKAIGVQVNGKVRGEIVISNDMDENTIKNLALNDENVKRHINGKEIAKVIVIKNRIVNIVIR